MDSKHIDLLFGVLLIVFVGGQIRPHKETAMTVPVDHTPHFPYYFEPIRDMPTQIASGSVKQWIYNSGINSIEAEITIYPNNPALKPVRIIIPKKLSA